MNKRRKFLGYLTSIALVPYLPARRAAATHLTGTEDTDPIPFLLELVPDNPTSQRLGAKAIQYLSRPDGPVITPGKLLGALAETPSSTVHQLRLHLQSLRNADFAAGDTITLDGWILARSEAEAIALVTLHRTA
jgi:hypothetical protein